MRICPLLGIISYMKENFEESLLSVNEALGKAEVADTDEKKNNIVDEIEYLTRYFVDEGTWSGETARTVFLLQKEKHELMGELHKKIQEIEEGKEISGFTEGEPRAVEWNKAGHRAMVVLPSGKRVSATVGELVTDGEWGLKYTLSKDVPLDIKKRFIIAEARRKILALADEQIIETERVKKTTREGGETSPSYRAIYEDEKTETRDGVIAEKIIETFFEKNILDHGLKMRLERVDRQRDVDEKIDFIFHLPRHQRGVGVDASDEREDIGIQLTVSNDPKLLKHKAKKIEEAKETFDGKRGEVDDIVLVTLPLKHMQEKIVSWKNEEMLPGGPMKKWEASKQEQIFRGVLQKLFPDKEITGMWESVLGEIPDDDGAAKNLRSRGEEDEGGKENLQKFENKYGKWSISTRKLK